MKSEKRDGYDGNMDPECIDLCNALNEIPGIETISSCCGHGKDGFAIWFRAKSISPLFIVGRAISWQYAGGPETWECKLSICDIENDPIHFWLTSNNTKGKQAYEEAKMIAANIRFLLYDRKDIAIRFGVKGLK